MIKIKNLQTFLPWTIPGILLLAWIIISHTKFIPHYLLPYPLEIVKTGYSYIFSTPGSVPYAGRFTGDLSVSLIRVGCGFILATFLGLPLGILSGRVAMFNKMLSTPINGLRAVPGITWLPLAMVWLGIGIRTTIFLVALAAFFPIYLNSVTGAMQINPHLLQAGAMMGVGRLRTVFSIILPGSMPHIIAGLRLGLGISWAYLVLGELTGVPNGLGAVIMDARMLGRVDMIVVGMIIIAVIGRLSDRLLIAFLKSCFKSARRMY